LVHTSRLRSKLIFGQTWSRLGGLAIDSCKLASLDRVTRLQLEKKISAKQRCFMQLCPLFHSGLGILLRAFGVCPLEPQMTRELELLRASDDTRVWVETRWHTTRRRGAVVGWFCWKPRVPPMNTTNSRVAWQLAACVNDELERSLEAVSTMSHYPRGPQRDWEKPRVQVRISEISWC